MPARGDGLVRGSSEQARVVNATVIAAALMTQASMTVTANSMQRLGYFGQTVLSAMPIIIPSLLQITVSQRMGSLAGSLWEVKTGLWVSTASAIALTFFTFQRQLSDIDSMFDARYVVLCLLGLSVGIGGVAFQLVSNTQQWAPKSELGSVTAIQTGVGSMCIGIGMFFMGVLERASQSDYLGFAALSFFLTIATVLAMLYLQKAPSQQLHAHNALLTGCDLEEAAKKFGQEYFLNQEDGAHLRDRRVAVLMGANTAAYGAFLALGAFLPLILVDHYKMGALAAASLACGAGVLASVVNMLVGHVSIDGCDKSKGVYTFIAGSLVTVTGCFMMALFPTKHWTLLAAGVGLMAIGIGVCGSSPFSLVMHWQSPPNTTRYPAYNASQTMGDVALVGGVAGGIILPLAKGLLIYAAGPIGYSINFMLMAVMNIIVSAGLWAVHNDVTLQPLATRMGGVA